MSDAKKTQQTLLEELAELRRDVDELKGVDERLRAAELELRQSEDVLEAISQQSLMGLVLLQDFRVIYANETYSQICEYTLEEILGWSAKDLLALVHPEDLEFVIGQLKKKQAGDTDDIVTAYSYRGVTKHGNVRWLDQHSRTITYQGRPADLVALIDFTEQKEAELALQQAKDELEQRVAQRTAALEQANAALQREVRERKRTEELIRTEREQLLKIFDNIDAVIYVCDVETHEVLFINRTLRALFGEVVGQRCYRVFQGRDEPCAFCTNAIITAEGATGAHIWEFQNQANGRWYHCIDQAFRWTDGRLARLEIAIDVDERKRATEELERAYAELQELDELKDNFISNISHELRTPMVSAKGYAELLMTKKALGEEDRERVRRLHRGITRLEVIIEDLLDISQLSAKAAPPELVPVDLGAVIARCARLVEPRRKERGLRLEVDVATDLPPVRGDAAKLQSALRNLLDNAVKFSPDGGAVRVTARPGEDGWVVVSVADEGIGIAPAYHDRIFTRFFQIDSSSTRLYTGAGIGLALVKEIVELHRGAIRVESAEGAGATFHLTLPAA